MFDDESPLPEPKGALVPPRRFPPTAVGLDMLPEPREDRFQNLRQLFRRVVAGCMNAIDNVADSVAHTLRLR